MNLSKKRLIIIGLFAIVTAILLIGIYKYVWSVSVIDLQSLPKGELQSQVTSPDGNYTLKIYLCNGGATVDYAIRGEIVFNNGKKETKNIYWNYHEKSSEVKWIDEQTVEINGIKLNIFNDEYDWRKE